MEREGAIRGEEEEESVWREEAGGGGGGRVAPLAPRYLSVWSPLSKCLLWTRLAANWLQLTLYWDELEGEHETRSFWEKDGEKPHTCTRSPPLSPSLPPPLLSTPLHTHTSVYKEEAIHMNKQL